MATDFRATSLTIELSPSGRIRPQNVATTVAIGRRRLDFQPAAVRATEIDTRKSKRERYTKGNESAFQGSSIDTQKTNGAAHTHTHTQTIKQYSTVARKILETYLNSFVHYCAAS